ncbi:MAG: radical SAM family heme chaperone HemW, partial [Candidatus Mariimomonas ferrooxydans]
MSISLYVHIPFCLKRCIYCDFVSGIYNPVKAGEYIKALKKEILNISNETSISQRGIKDNENYPSPIPLPQGEGASGCQTRLIRRGEKDIFSEETTFKSLYIGGGTPSVLSTNILSDLTNHIFSNLDFVQGYEATIEVNPGTLDNEKLQALYASGINRISIGVQSFNDDELDCLGRLHSSYDAEQAVYLAGNAGFENIGIDLIYGIPGQNKNSWLKTLQKAVSLKPRHISAYELTVEQGTLLSDYTKTLRLKCIKDEIIIEMYGHAVNQLKAEGFAHYEISNFAKPGYSCRHNLNYWRRGEYYGAGSGAHSFIKGKRFYNTDNLEDYIKSLLKNKSPIKGTEDITEQKAMSEAFFLGLGQTGGINLKNFHETYDRDILMFYHKEIRELQKAGLIEVNGLPHSSTLPQPSLT